MLHKRFIFILSFLAVCTVATAQNIDVDRLMNIKERKAVKLSGGISAGSTYYQASEMYGRQPFTYQFTGNLNISLYDLINIPLSVNLNNYGAQYTYPSLPNRLSLYPSYKWIKACIGDVSMSFSPYTLSGHMFTGGGVDLTPGRWNIMAMGGRLLRRVDFNPENPGVPPTYDRWGAGAKVRYNGGKFFAGASFFTAKDQAKETFFAADSMGIFPKSNMAASIEGGVNITSNLRLSAEYAISILSRDIRPVIPAEGDNDIIERNAEENHYSAVKASLDYTFRKNTIGLGYERIDPQYATLGAYYFNNDFENITLNYARPLFSGKANIALNGGLQRDDLDGSKESRSVRWVGSANFTYAPAEKLNMTLSASTFQGHRLIKSQFDYINQTTPYDNLDTLNFTQISQNIDFNLNWTIRSGKITTQNITFFAGYQEAADKQGEYILPGNLSRFLNASTIYSMDLTPINTIFNMGFNVSNNYSNRSNFLTLGPIFAMNVRMFKKTLMTGVSLSFNRSMEKSVPVADIFNCRWNANIRFFKRHAVQASAMYQQQKRTIQGTVKETNSFTAQLGYTCSF